MVRDFSGYNGTGAYYTAGTNFGAGKNRNVSCNLAVVPNRYAADIQYGKIRIPFLHLRPDKKWQNELLEVLWTVFHLDQDAPEFYLLCQEAVFRIFTLLYTNNMELLSEKSEKADISLIQLRKMVGYIQKHYQDSIMLDDIAKIGEMGKTACCNIFKKYMNTSPIDYVITYRLAQSTVLLTETRLPITEIAYGSGFHNASYYTKYFRKQYGKTPGQMRKEYLKQGLNVGRADGSFQNSRTEAALQRS